MENGRGVGMELLEERRLLSAAIRVVDGTLIVRGTQRADHIVVDETVRPFRDGETPRKHFHVTLNGRQRWIDAAGIRRVRVEAGAGDDRVQMSDDPFEVLPPGTGRIAMIVVQQSKPATIVAGDGDDTLIGGSAGDSVSGGAGHDQVAGMGGNDTLDGDGHGDTLVGHAGADLIRGGAGDDRFTTDEHDRVLGGFGNDFQILRSTRQIVNDAQPEVKEIEGYITHDSPDAPDVRRNGDTLEVRGTRRSDVIRVQRSLLWPGALQVVVNDRVVEGVSMDGLIRIRIDGGAGNDLIAIGPESHDDLVFILPPLDLPLHLFGGAGDDTLVGADSDDRLFGEDGDDVLAGGLGHDHLDGGPGRDTLRGNDGHDSLVNGETADQGQDPGPILGTFA